MAPFKSAVDFCAIFCIISTVSVFNLKNMFIYRLETEHF